jgi:hypothetical protein
VPWKLLVRVGPRVERTRFDLLRQALDAAEQRARELSETTARQPAGTRLKRFEPVQHVAARIELAGPERLLASRHAGIDVRGDGSTEAYLGRIRRQPVELRGGETALQALRRVLAEGT